MANFRVVPIFSVSEEIFLSKSKVQLHLSRQPSIAEIVVNLNIKYLNVNVNVSISMAVSSKALADRLVIVHT